MTELKVEVDAHDAGFDAARLHRYLFMVKELFYETYL